MVYGFQKCHPEHLRVVGPIYVYCKASLTACNSGPLQLGAILGDDLEQSWLAALPVMTCGKTTYSRHES